VPYAPAVFRAVMTDLRQQKFDLRIGLAQVHCRTLVVHGRQDAIPESVAYEIRGAMPQLELHFIERSGHFPWLEQPEESFRVLRAFLAKH
jgi:proline iminopeptidase